MTVQEALGPDVNLSFVAGSGATPLKYETIGQAFDDAAQRFASRDALIVPLQQVRWSYAELKRRVDLLAAGFLSLGLKPGDRIGIWAPNCAEWAVTQFASAKAGLILVNINPAYRLSELEFCLRKVGCRALITAERLKNIDYLSMLRALAPELDSCAANKRSEEHTSELKLVIRLGRAPTAGCLNFEDVMQGTSSDRERLAQIGADLQPDD